MTFLQIGKYSFHIIGNKECIDLLPNYWNKYQLSNTSTIHVTLLYLKEKELERKVELTDGWSLRIIDDTRLAQYTIHGKPIFELGYNFLFSNDVTIYISKSLDSYIRSGIEYGMLLSLYKNGIGLHGVTLMCRDEIIILSAPSGTGKTTLSQLLEKYCEALIINGDFALLSVSKEGVIFEPTPFCGTSQRCLNHRVKVDRIVFLSQSKNNLWETLTGRQAILNFLNNSFIPSWEQNLEQAVKNNIVECLSYLKVNSYSFAPTRDAAEIFFEMIKNS